MRRRRHPAGDQGIVDDGNPNAFTFGRTPRDARVWVTRGLLERLDERELDAVVAHEVGHIKHWDFAVMTLAAVIPMVLYLAYLVARGSGRNEARAVASQFGMGMGLALAGLLFFVKQQFRYPGDHEPVDDLAGLLERLDAGPVAGIPVTMKGRIVGRGMPGYLLSPDLVVADSSGFVTLLYRQPLPLVASLFGLFRAGAFQGQEVVARGWYRRLPGPVIELRDVHALSGRRARTWEWVARYVGSVLLILAGVALTLVGLV